MHELDSALQEFEMGIDALESGDFEFEFEFEGEWDGQGETVFDEMQEMEFAANLMEISDQQEFEQFLGRLMRSAGQAAGRALRSDTARALGGVLRDAGRAALPGLQQAARQALPVLGGGLGDMAVPGGRGREGGQQIAAGVGRMLGLELEGLDPEDQEFEIARTYVRLVGDAVRRAAQMGSAGSPAAAARQAVMAAARNHAPGLVRVLARASGGQGRQGEMNGFQGGGGFGGSGGGGGSGRSGRWIRRGRNIVLLDL